MPRIDWEDLPAITRRTVERETGPVLKAETALGGANSGIAVTLHTADGRIFCKGVSSDHRQVWTQRQEADINPHVLAMTPRLLWQIESGGWNLLGFEHVDGRHADLAPNSPDLPKVAEILLLLGGIPYPDLPLKTAERRWATYADPSASHLFRGDNLLHTDLAPHNMLIDGGGHLIDWAWPTRGPAWVDAVVLIIRLIDAGHVPAEAAAWSEQFPAWITAPADGVDAFTVAVDRMWREIAAADPQPWKLSMAASAHQWRNHRVPRR
jgi:hypothetical protein